MNAIQNATIDAAGQNIAAAAMRLVAKHPLMRHEHVDTVLLAMRSATKQITANLLEDMKAGPGMANAAIQIAILDLANAGIRAIPAGDAQ